MSVINFAEALRQAGTCQRCGESLPDDDIVYVDGKALCFGCVTLVELDQRWTRLLACSPAGSARMARTA
jgi:hypothetical protein